MNDAPFWFSLALSIGWLGLWLADRRDPRADVFLVLSNLWAIAGLLLARLD